MGLIGGILAPLYIGGRTVLLSPQSFIRQPLRWLETVSRYRAMVTGAPNFAFDLCADRLTPTEIAALDLSPLRLLFCGAEPISATSLNRFAQRLAGAGLSDDIFYPCYGLAESTLLAAGGDGPGRLQTIEIDRASLGQGRVRVVPEGSPKSATLVNCGRAAWQSELVIVDPVSGEEVPQRTVGEIWIRGETVSKGYWQADPADMERFNAELVRTRRGIVSLIGRSVSQRTGGFYRTGDLGFFDGGDLYVTGRIKEVIIVRGRNCFPRDRRIGRSRVRR
jgi:acyl-CoA synthetase (AMP-forming)/AMP-acid ligase II